MLNNLTSIDKFLEYFGHDSTTNFDLLDWSKMLGIPNLKVVMCNELEKLRTTKKSYIICNYQSTTQNGSHRVALYRDKNHLKNFYFDSFGIEPFPEAIDFLENGFYSIFKIQPEGSKIYGVLCLFVLYKLSQGKDFFDTILELNNYFNY